MKLKKKPCSKCPYKLGMIHTTANPCPQCMFDGYQAYKWFQKAMRQEKESKDGDRYEEMPDS